MKVRSLFVTILIASVWLTACGGATATPAPQTIKFAYDYWPGYYPALIAIDQGYYAEQNLTVNAIKPENTDTVLADFTAGTYDAIAVSLGDVVNLTQANPDIYIVIVSDESAGGDAVMASADIQTIEDLKGKTLGVNLGGFAEVFVTTVLNEHGLSLAEVNFVSLDAADIPANLQNGTIVAGETWEPYVTEAKQNGAHVLFTSADTPGLIPDVVAFRGPFVREHPEAVRAFVQGWFKAVEFWQANPAAGNAAAANILKVDPNTISLDGIKIKSQADNVALFTPGETTASLYYTANLYVDFFVSNGNLTSKPDVSKLLNAEYLK
jgi:NitT/TauT family transport system substrate-binding protein